MSKPNDKFEEARDAKAQDFVSVLRKNERGTNSNNAGNREFGFLRGANWALTWILQNHPVVMGLVEGLHKTQDMLDVLWNMNQENRDAIVARYGQLHYPSLALYQAEVNKLKGDAE